MVSDVKFLLIQDGIVDSAENPAGLAFSFVDAYAGFQVAIGCTNEFGQREIVSLVASVAPLAGASCWRVSSFQDGNNRLVGAAGSPASLVRVRLCAMYEHGRYDDLCQLPQPILVWPDKALVA